MIPRIRLSRLLFSIAFGALFANVFAYTWVNANPLVHHDGWRYTELFLKPVFEGTEWSWSLLWSDHHPQPINALLFIANAKLFDLRLDYEALGTLFFLLAFALLLYRLYLRGVEGVGAGDGAVRLGPSMSA